MQSAIEQVTQQLEEWPTDKLTPNPFNPRGPVQPDNVRELADSIREQGILQPLTVTPDGIIVIGHRRHAAAKLVFLEKVPVIVRAYDLDKQMEIMLIENIQREDLTPLQEAKAYERFVNGGMMQTEIARRVSVPPNRVQLRMMILKLQPEAQELFDTFDMPLTIAPVLAKILDPARQMKYAILASRRSMPISRLEELIRRSEGVKKSESSQRGGRASKGRTLRQGPSRDEAVVALGRRVRDSISYDDIGKVLERVCCACGIKDDPAVRASICSACPLPLFVKEMAEVGHG